MYDLHIYFMIILSNSMIGLPDTHFSFGVLIDCFMLLYTGFKGLKNLVLNQNSHKIGPYIVQMNQNFNY